MAVRLAAYLIRAIPHAFILVAVGGCLAEDEDPALERTPDPGGAPTDVGADSPWGDVTPDPFAEPDEDVRVGVDPSEDVASADALDTNAHDEGDGEGGGGEGDSGDTAPDGGPSCEGLALRSDGVLDVDLAAVTVRGRVTLNGAGLPERASSRGWLRFRAVETASDLRVDLGTSGEATYVVTLSPGRYDVFFDGVRGRCGGADTELPCTSGRLAAGLELRASGALDLNVVSVHVEGAVTLNGETPPDQTAPRGWLAFDGGWSDPGRVSLGAAGPADYAITLVAGPHAIAFEAPSGLCRLDSYTPCADGPLIGPVALTTSGVLDLDVPVATVQGRVTGAGEALPNASRVRGRLRFELDGGGLAETLGFVPSGEALYEVRLLPGSYRASWVAEPRLCDGDSPLPLVPCLDGPLLDEVGVGGDGVLDLDLSAVRVAGTVTAAGAPFPTGERSAVGLRFTLDGGGRYERNGLASSGASARYEVVLLAGSYDIAFVGRGEGCALEEPAPVPCNTGPLARGVLLTTDGVLDLDVPRVTVSGRVTLNGAPFEEGSGPAGGVLVFAVEGGEPFRRAAFELDPAGYVATVLPGMYTVGFEPDAELCSAAVATRSPCVGGELVDAVALTADGLFDIDIPAIRVSGRVTLAGEPAPEETHARGRLAFRRGEGGEWRSPSLSATAPMTYETTLLPGVFTLTYEPGLDLCAVAPAPSLPCTDQVVNPCE